MDYYQVLGLEAGATPEEIKRAYFRLIRERSPEADPEAFQQLQEAYEVLSDPDRRAEYDSCYVKDAEISRLWPQAAEALQAANWEAAMQPLNRLLEITPGDCDVRNQLGVCLMMLKRWEEAIAVHLQTLSLESGHAPSLKNLGHCYSARAEQPGLDETDRRELHRKAASCFLGAGDLVPLDSEAFFLAAWHFYQLQDYPQALSCAVQYVRAGARTGPHDPDALFFLCRLFLEQGRFDGYVLTSKRLYAAVPETPKSRRYASDRFVELALSLACARNFEAAWRALTSAKQLDSTNEAIPKIAEDLGIVAAAFPELCRLESDPAVPEEVRALARAVFRRRLQQDDDSLQRLRSACERISQMEDEPLRLATLRMENVYPAVLKMVQPHWPDRKELSQAPAAENKTQSLGRYGWAFVVFVILMVSCMRAAYRNTANQRDNVKQQAPGPAAAHAGSPPVLHEPKSNTYSRSSTQRARPTDDTGRMEQSLSGTPQALPASAAAGQQGSHAYSPSAREYSRRDQAPYQIGGGLPSASQPQTNSPGMSGTGMGGTGTAGMTGGRR